MRETRQVVVLSGRGVDTKDFKRVLTGAQDDARSFEFEFIEGLNDKFPEATMQSIKPGDVVVFLWDPNKKHSQDCFKQMILKFSNTSHMLVFCQVGAEVVSDEHKTLLEKWLAAATIPKELYCIPERGITVEASQLMLLDIILKNDSSQKDGQGFEVVPLGASTSSADAGSAAFFEKGYGHDLSRSHSRQTRANFIEMNYKPNAQGQFGLDQLVQLYAVYMSVPVGSDLSKMVEKALAKALMTVEDNQQYLQTIDLSRSTFLGKGWDWVSTKLEKLLKLQFSNKHPDKCFESVVSVLKALQDYVSAQETSWGYKWGGAATKLSVDTTIQKIMELTGRIYPCLFKSDITPADRIYLNCEYPFPREITDIIDNAFPGVVSELKN